MARCPDCQTKVAPWRKLAIETEAKPLVCRACGAVLRTRPGWLTRSGFVGAIVAQFAVPAVHHPSRGLRVAICILLTLVAPVCACALFAPVEKKGADR